MTKTAKRIRRFLDDELLDIPGGPDPLAAGLIDSLAIEQLIAFLEDEVGVLFADDELVAGNFASIDVLADLVDAKRAGVA